MREVKTKMLRVFNPDTGEYEYVDTLQGEPGKTPVRGIDYWTEADKKDVAELVPIVKVAEQPTFVDSVADMTDTSKVYVLKSDENVTTTVPDSTTVPNFTNLATTLSDGYRFNSSGVATAESGTTVIEDYIPYVTGDVVRVKGFSLATKNIVLYDASKAVVSSATLANQTTLASEMEGDVYKITNNSSSKVHYIRFSGIVTGDAEDVIVTINQEITYTVIKESAATIWAYGKVDNQPAFTDLTKQDGWTWTENSRTNSSGTFTEDVGSHAGSYIPCVLGDIIRIKGLKLKTSYSDTLNVQFFNSEKGYLYASTTAYLRATGIITEDGVLTTIEGGKQSSDGTNITEDNKIAYMRFSGIPYNGYDINDVIITVNEEIKYISGYHWKDTGIVYNQPPDYEDRVIALETATANNSADIGILKQQIADIGSGEAAITTPEWWEDEVEDTIAKIKALQVGRNCITFPFFSDNHQRNGYAGMLIAKVMKECNIPYCFYGGDSISSGYIDSEATMIAQDKAFDTMMQAVPNGRFCRAVGNHDGYWAVSSTENHTYSRDQVYELFLREESIAQNKHFGADGTYYYVDDIASKVRWIVLNTNGGSVDSAQLAWMQDAAFSFDEGGWAIVFISHQPISNHYHANISNAAEVRSVVQNYINGTNANKAAVAGWFSGHIHKDRIYTGVATNTTDDAQGAAMGFTQVTITSDHTGIAYDDATKHTVANDDQSHAVDFATINKATRTVNLTRLGIGEDRSYTY